MPKPQLRGPVAAKVPCRINAKDISAMDYWLNESPMADPTRQNAICFALQRLLSDGSDIVLCEKGRNRVEAVVNGSIALPLPKELAGWWQRVLVGHLPQPVSAALEIPVDLLAPAVRAAALEKRSPAYAWPEAFQANAA